MLIGIVTVIIFLSILILVHELGHFLTAKKFGLLVEEFGFGLPPRIWGKKIGETIYSINALPFGGFVKILGEDRIENEGENEEKIDYEINKQVSILQMEEKITESESRLEIEDKLVVDTTTIFSKNRSFSSLAISKRAMIIFAGVLMNFLLGWLVISLVFSIGIPSSILVTDLKTNGPAAEIGLMAGDKILGAKVKLDDSQYSLEGQIGAENFIKFIDKYRGQKVVLEVERDGKIYNFQIIPRINPPAGEGALGIVLVETGLMKQNILNSLIEGFKTSVEVIKAIFVAIFNLIIKAFIGKASLEQIAGPVGIVKITSQAESLGFVYLLQLLALISLNLAVINILPFPALDGGRLLFLLIEKIKGSPLPVKFERYANAIGMVLLLFLMAVITIKDIIKII